MKQKLFNMEIMPACEYCENGKISPTGNDVLCLSHGVMPLDGSCKKFKYDALKRTPKRRPSMMEFSPSDFEI